MMGSRCCKILLAAAVLAAPVCVQAKDFGKHGAVFEIEETPLFEMIQKRLAEQKAAGKFDEINETLKKNTIAGVSRPAPVKGLTEAREAYSYVFDPSIVIQEDIDDGRGNLIAAAGTEVNPFDHVQLDTELLFIRGDNPAHVELAGQLRDERNGKLKVIYVSGSPFEGMKSEQYRVYFDQSGVLTKRLEITKVPALVRQEGRVLQIREIPANAF